MMVLSLEFLFIYLFLFILKDKTDYYIGPPYYHVMDLGDRVDCYLLMLL